MVPDEPDDAAAQAVACRLMERLKAIVRARQWKHNEDAGAGDRLVFWFANKVPVAAAVTILDERSPRGHHVLPMVFLYADCWLTEGLIRSRARDLLAACARYGVSLVLADAAPLGGPGGPQRRGRLSVVVTERSLTDPSLEDAVMLLQAAALELSHLCQKTA